MVMMLAIVGAVVLFGVAAFGITYLINNVTFKE